jgi:hypothetical protein
MVDISRIPIEIRWRIATRMITFLPLAYNREFSDFLGENYATLEYPIFEEAAKDIRAIASAFQLPKHNAYGLARTMDVISSIFFGPGFQGETLEVSNEKALIRLTSCPLMNMADEIGVTAERIHQACTTCSKETVECLNPEYTINSSRSMCLGGAFCEMTIERKV